MEGVQHKSLEGVDIDICVTLKLNRKPDVDALDTNWHTLTEEQKECIEYVPRVKTKEFKEIVKNGNAGKLLNIVVETPGLASVKLKFD